MLEIVPIHYKLSKPVKHWKEIKSEVALMENLITHSFKGLWNKAFALAHCQVSETPMAFFVVAPECLHEKMFEHQIIINPQITKACTHKEWQGNQIEVSTNEIIMPNRIEYQEMCLSFPYRKAKTVARYDVIEVKYQIKGVLGLKTIKKELSGIASEIFQHEFDHINGKNIYFESQTPVKWWELIGTAKSKGGTSLDDPAGLELKRAKENHVD